MPSPLGLLLQHIDRAVCARSGHADVFATAANGAATLRSAELTQSKGSSSYARSDGFCTVWSTFDLPQAQATDVCRHCAMDSAISHKEPCDPCKDCAAQVTSPTKALTHNCTVNFNADGSLWACVPARCLLAGGRDQALPPSRVTGVMQELCGLAVQASTWMCSREPELHLPAPTAQVHASSCCMTQHTWCSSKTACFTILTTNDWAQHFGEHPYTKVTNWQHYA